MNSVKPIYEAPAQVVFIREGEVEGTFIRGGGIAYKNTLIDAHNGKTYHLDKVLIENVYEAGDDWQAFECSIVAQPERLGKYKLEKL